ncbi:MAG: hypothetical protein LBG28_15445 [Tannerella sp.]|jgi:hypothetical protein|nr:hypothetical protein [Tannerella sp.]
MKNLTLTFIFTVVTVFTANAQYDDLYTFEKGKSLIGMDAGVKFGADNKIAVSAFYEYSLFNLFVDECTLGAGVFGGYYRDKLKGEVEKIYITGVRVNVHYQFVDRLDTYAGLDPNFNIKTYKIQKDEAGFACYIHIGGRYYLTNWLGVFAEISTGYNNFRGGLSIKF